MRKGLFVRRVVLFGVLALVMSPLCACSYYKSTQQYKDAYYTQGGFVEGSAKMGEVTGGLVGMILTPITVPAHLFGTLDSKPVYGMLWGIPYAWNTGARFLGTSFGGIATHLDFLSEMPK